MARRYQIKIYDRTQATLVATLSDTFIISGQQTQQLLGEDTLLFTVLKDHADYAHVQEARIARLVDTVDLWERAYRIISVIPKREGEIYKIEVKCEGMQYDLSYAIHSLSSSLIDQTPLTHMTQILSVTSWAVGTITPTTRVTMEYDYNTVMFDLIKLRDEVSAVSGTEYDLEFATTPAGSKTVSLKVVGQTSPVSSIEYAKNLTGLTYERKLPINIVYGRGGEGSKGIPMTIANATHRITAIASNTITLDSRKVVSSNGTWDASYSIEKPSGALTDITASIKPASGNDQLTLADASGLAVDDYVRIVGSSGGNVDIVWDKASFDVFGARIDKFQDENFSDVFNLLGPARFSTLSGTYTSGLCEGWQLVGAPTVSENTDAQYIRNGSKSQRVQTGTFTPEPAINSTEALDYSEMSGTYLYKASYLTNGGEGNLAASASSPLAVTNEGILVTFSSVSVPATATHRRLYRTKAGGSTYYKIADVPIAQTVFFDAIPDRDLTVTHSGVNTAGGGDGIKRSVTAVVGEQYSAVIYLYAVTGRVRCFLSSGSESYPTAIMPDSERATPNVSVKTTFVVLIPQFTATTTTVTLNVVGHDGNDDFYVDSAMLVKSAYPPNPDKFVPDNEATELWHKTYDHLQKVKDQTLSSNLAISFVDLQKVGIGADLINVGDRVNISDSKLGLSLTGASAPRVIRKSFDIVDPHNGEIEINSAVPRLTDDYYNRRRREQQLSRRLSRNITRVADDFRADKKSAAPVVVIKKMTE